MALIDFYIRNQKLFKTGPKIVADSINYISCSFTFKTDDWNGMDKWVSFKKGEEAYNVNLVDDAIPKEVGLNLGEGVWTVLVFGEGENTRITTNTVTVEVEGSAIPEGGPLPAIELTEAEQIAAKAQEALNAAEEVKTKAENGDFDGHDITHEWVGTVLKVTSASGTSEADLKGEVGPQGPEGPAGPQGPEGPKGADGTMTFEDLTEEQKESLRGPQGPEGPTGPTGPTGETGPQGPAGKDGEPGYTPVKGTDYYTETEKNEIINAVLTQIPIYDGSVG